MKSIIIKLTNKKEFEVVFSLISEFGKDRKRLSLDDEEFGLAFLMNAPESVKEVAARTIIKK